MQFGFDDPTTLDKPHVRFELALPGHPARGDGDDDYVERLAQAVEPQGWRIVSMALTDPQDEQGPVAMRGIVERLDALIAAAKAEREQIVSWADPDSDDDLEEMLDSVFLMDIERAWEDLERERNRAYTEAAR